MLNQYPSIYIFFPIFISFSLSIKYSKLTIYIYHFLPDGVFSSLYLRFILERQRTRIEFWGTNARVGVGRRDRPRAYRSFEFSDRRICLPEFPHRKKIFCVRDRPFDRDSQFMRDFPVDDVKYYFRASRAAAVVCRCRKQFWKIRTTSEFSSGTKFRARRRKVSNVRRRRRRRRQVSHESRRDFATTASSKRNINFTSGSSSFLRLSSSSVTRYLYPSYRYFTFDRRKSSESRLREHLFS